MSAELQTRRGRLFFWIGIVVFPVFWLWWMNARQFTTWQIRSARLWTALYMLAVAVAWWVSPAFRSRVSNLPWSYADIAIQIGMALWIWLLFRAFRFDSLFIGYVIGGEIIFAYHGPIAHLLQPMLPLYRAMPQYLTSLLFILIPATGHLLLEPARRFRVRRFIRIPWYSMNQTLVTEDHAPVNLTQALQIADEYYSRASVTIETDEKALAAMTFGIGWADQYMEFCINSTTQISCILQTSYTSSSWFRRPMKVSSQHQQQLHSRDALRQRIHDLFACSPEELRHRCKKQRCP